MPVHSPYLKARKPLLESVQPCAYSFAVTLILATRNAHKVQEIQAKLGDNFQVQSMSAFGDPPLLVEDAATFAGNATCKAVQLAEWLANRAVPANALVLADDSGLEVDALNGAPGVHSARFAALDKQGNSPDAANNAKLMKLLESVPLEERTARFRCALALTPIPLAAPQGASPVCYTSEAELNTLIFEGACEGRIALSPAGKRGFGYDPLFVPTGATKSFAELSEAEKNQISHRACALEKLARHLITTKSAAD